MKLVIRQHRPLRKALIILGATLSALLAVAIALDYGRWRAIAGAMVATGETRTLLEEASALREENTRLRFEVARLRRTEQINRSTREENHALLVGVRSELATMKREVQFYRDAIGAVEVGAGPRVGGIQVRALDGVGRYGYKVVMTHVETDDKVAEGFLRLALRGDYKGRGKALALADLVESGPGELSFKFKHFHLFEGTIRLPEGFVPRQIEVAVRTRGQGPRATAETYDWAAVLN